MKRRGTLSGDQWLLVLCMLAIATLVINGLLMMAYAPNAKPETVIPLVSLGIQALASMAGKPSFPVPSPTQEAAPAGPVEPAAPAAKVDDV